MSTINSCAAALRINRLEERDHLLVVAVHEVDLDALDPHRLVLREHRVHPRFQRTPVRPYPDADAALPRMVDQHRQVELRDRAGDVGFGIEATIAGAAHVPAVVDQHVLQLQCCGMVDVAPDRRGVHAGIRHVRRHAAGPPVPRGPARLDP
jgi:hypothetical protein